LYIPSVYSSSRSFKSTQTKNIDFTKYKGMYVALVDEKVVASGKNAKVVLDIAKTRYPEKEIVLREIPEEETLAL
jgi:hypothetical protein